jgi:hypothetical protein
MRDDVRRHSGRGSASVPTIYRHPPPATRHPLPATGYRLPATGEGKNWLATIPDKGWFTIFRLYGPKEAFFDQTWKLPDIEKVK